MLVTAQSPCSTGCGGGVVVTGSVGSSDPPVDGMVVVGDVLPPVEGVVVEDWHEVMGINTRDQLDEARDILRRRES